MTLCMDHPISFIPNFWQHQKTTTIGPQDRPLVHTHPHQPCQIRWPGSFERGPLPWPGQGPSRLPFALRTQHLQGTGAPEADRLTDLGSGYLHGRLDQRFLPIHTVAKVLVQEWNGAFFSFSWWLTLDARFFFYTLEYWPHIFIYITKIVPMSSWPGKGYCWRATLRNHQSWSGAKSSTGRTHRTFWPPPRPFSRSTLHHPSRARRQQHRCPPLSPPTQRSHLPRAQPHSLPSNPKT